MNNAINKDILAEGKFHKFDPELDDEVDEGDWGWFDSNITCDSCIPSVIISKEYFQYLLENQK